MLAKSFKFLVGMILGVIAILSYTGMIYRYRLISLDPDIHTCLNKGWEISIDSDRRITEEAAVQSCVSTNNQICG